MSNYLRALFACDRILRNAHFNETGWSLEKGVLFRIRQSYFGLEKLQCFIVGKMVIERMIECYPSYPQGGLELLVENDNPPHHPRQCASPLFEPEWTSPVEVHS